MSTLNVGNITDGTNSVGTEKLSKGTAAAWVNFNGTGTVTINNSYNVSSITDNGVGDYNVNFTTAMTSQNYCTTFSYTNEVNVAHTVGFITGQQTTYVRIAHYNPANGSNTADKSVVNVAVFGS